MKNAGERKRFLIGLQPGDKQQMHMIIHNDGIPQIAQPAVDEARGTGNQIALSRT